MLIKYNKEQLKRIIEDIFILTGISIAILDTEHNAVTTTMQKQEYCRLLQKSEAEAKLCRECDKKILKKCAISKKLERHICRAGLYDCAMPIIKYDTIIAYVLMGQIRSLDSPCELNYIPEGTPQTIAKLKELYKQTPFMTEQQLSGLYDLLPHILFNDAIEFVYDPLANKIIEFIDENLHRKISTNELCTKFHISKNFLYETFRKNLNNTITGYINDQRIHRAKKLLKQTNYPVFQIAEMVGIDNYTYFCKLFKKTCKITPADYRRKGGTTPDF